MNKGLEKDLAKLTELGYIEESQFKRIQKEFLTSTEHKRTNSLLLAFSLLGVMFIGAGIISIFAFNWSMFSALTKTVVALVPLLIIQGLLYWKISTSGTRVWIQSLSLALGISFITALSLIYQAYQLSFSIQSMLVITLVVMVPIVYLLDAYYLAIACLLGIVISASSVPNYYILSVVALLPYYIEKLNSEENCNILTLCYMYLGLHISIMFIDIRLYPYMLLAVGVLYVAISNHRYFKSIAKPALFLTLFFMGTSVGTSLMWQTDFKDMLSTDSSMIIQLASFVIVLVIANILLARQYYKSDELESRLDIIIIISLQIISMIVPIILPTIQPALFNLLLISLCISKIVLGTAENYQPTTRKYLGILCLYVILKVLSADIDLIPKGICFILVGAGFLITNYFISRRTEVH